VEDVCFLVSGVLGVIGGRGRAVAALDHAGRGRGVGQHLLWPGVVEADSAKLNPTLDARQFARAGRVGDLRLRIQDVQDALAGGSGFLELVEAHGQVADGVEEHVKVEQESDQRPGGHLTLQDAHTPKAEDNRHADLRDEVNARHEDGGQLVGAEGGSEFGGGDFAEALFLAVLADERLDDAHSGQALLQRSRDDADRLAHGTVAPVGIAPPPQGQPTHSRQNGEREQGKLPVQHQQHHDDSHQSEGIANGVDDGPGDEVLQRVAVFGDAGHQVADAVVVEVAQVQVEILVKEALAYVHDGVLADPDHVVHLNAQANRLDDEHRQKGDAEADQGGFVAFPQSTIDRLAHQSGRTQRAGRRDQHQPQDEQHTAAVWAREADQPGERFQHGPFQPGPGVVHQVSSRRGPRLVVAANSARIWLSAEWSSTGSGGSLGGSVSSSDRPMPRMSSTGTSWSDCKCHSLA